MLFQDYAGAVREDLEAFAAYRADKRAPLLGGCECPAAEYTFAISEDEGATWRNPPIELREQLTEAIIATGRCCRQLGEDCPLRLDQNSYMG